MFTNEDHSRIDKTMMIINKLWVSMFVSLLIYLVIGHFIKNTFQISIGEPESHYVRFAFYIMAIASLSATKFIKTIILKPQNLDQVSETTIQRSFLSRYLTASIVSLALLESIGIYGLVMVILLKNLTDL